MVDEAGVTAFLDTNPEFLERYVTSSAVSREAFSRWGQQRRRAQRGDSLRSFELPSTPWTNRDLSSRRRILLDHGDQTLRLLYELTACCGQLVGMASEMLELVVHNDEGAFVVYKSRTEQQFKLKKMATHFASEGTLFDSFTRQRKLSSFLLDVAKSIFQDIVSMDAVILKVMNYAQKLVSAERASLFLVDSKTEELYARIFDVGQGTDEHVKINKDGQKEIRFPMSKGIAGVVAATGQGLNIEDAYTDPRFNKDIDERTGYRTRSILCMPIFIRHHVIGVVQMVNKTDGIFNKSDEDAFEMFAVYCGLALHHAKLYDKIRRSEQKNRVALEVLAYHSVCNRDEVAKLKKITLRDRIEELETYDFNGMRLSELEKPLYAVYMFKHLFHETM
ncbi:unnamed protein product, partial [Mesorhabditis spiculigera]